MSHPIFVFGIGFPTGARWACSDESITRPLADDKVLAQPLLSKAHRAEAISLKKLLKGDGSWATRKLILGWIIDTLRQTLEIPAYCKETLANILEDLKGRKRVKRQAWQSILGKLRFISIAIPGSAGLFSACN